MENLSEIIKKILVPLLVLFIFVSGQAQGDFLVYRLTGEPYMEVNDSIKSVKRGSILNASTKLTMNRDDFVQLINEEGDVFEIYETGTLTYKDIQNVPAIKDNASLSKKLVNYLWKEITNSMASRNNKAGVIYRGDAITELLFPPDSSVVFGEVRFGWEPIKNKEKEYYLILKDIETGRITTIGTPSTSISLGIDEGLIETGKSYAWTITETRYPALKKTPMNSFTVLSEEKFIARQEEIRQLQSFYKKLGLNKSEIRAAICADYKICF